MSGYWKYAGTYSDEVWKGFNWNSSSLKHLWAESTYEISSGLQNSMHLSSMWVTNPNVSHKIGVAGKDVIYKIYASLNNSTNGTTYTEAFYYDHGRCYTFKPNKGIYPPPGKLHGYNFLFYKVSAVEQEREKVK